MFLKINEAIKGLALLPKICKALYENTMSLRKNIKFNLDNLKYSFKLSRSLGCKPSTINSYYKHIGEFHLEVLAHNGIFLHKSHRIDDLYPNITVLDNDLKSFEKLAFLLEKCLCKLNFINLDINTEKINLNVTFTSVSLPFVLERLNGKIQAIETFLLNLKSQLNENKSIIFGMVALKNPSKPNKNFSKYVDYLNKKNIYYNSELTVEQLDTVFNKHFDYVTLYFEGSCLFFLLQPEQKKIKAKPTLPKDDPLEMPFI